MAFDDLWYLNRSKTQNYFNKRQHSVEAWYRVKASEFFEKDPSLTGARLTSKCHALCNAAHQNMMEHRAQSMLPDPSIRFLIFGHTFQTVARPSDVDRTNTTGLYRPSDKITEQVLLSASISESPIRCTLYKSFVCVAFCLLCVVEYFTFC